MSKPARPSPSWYHRSIKEGPDTAGSALSRRLSRVVVRCVGVQRDAARARTPDRSARVRNGGLVAARRGEVTGRHVDLAHRGLHAVRRHWCGMRQQRAAHYCAHRDNCANRTRHCLASAGRGEKTDLNAYVGTRYAGLDPWIRLRKRPDDCCRQSLVRRAVGGLRYGQAPGHRRLTRWATALSRPALRRRTPRPRSAR